MTPTRQGQAMEDALITFLEWAIRCRKNTPANRIKWRKDGGYDNIVDRFDETLHELVKHLDGRVKFEDGRWTATLPVDDRPKPEPEAPAPLTEERVREIVREETRRDVEPAAPSEPVPVRVGQVWRSAWRGDYFVQQIIHDNVFCVPPRRRGGFFYETVRAVQADQLLYDPPSEEGEQAQEGE